MGSSDDRAQGATSHLVLDADTLRKPTLLTKSDGLVHGDRDRPHIDYTGGRASKYVIARGGCQQYPTPSLGYVARRDSSFS